MVLLSESEKKIIDNFINNKNNTIIFDINVDEYRSCIVENEIEKQTGIKVYCSEVYSIFPVKIEENSQVYFSDVLLNQKNRTSNKGQVKIMIY